MPASLQFAHPTLLLGLTAAALPLLIHWWWRQRPRRIRFPAVAFLHAAIASGRRARRLHNVWLLLTRALLLACAAFLLAGPTCTPVGARGGGPEPVACVVVLDDSWSTRYQLEPASTGLDRARRQAVTALESAAGWPSESEFGLVWADPLAAPQRMTRDRSVVVGRLRAAGARRAHAAPLGHALAEAGRLLRAAQQPTRQLLVFTDGADHAWRDVEPSLLAGLGNLSVRVLAVASRRRTNIALTQAVGPTRLLPAGVPVPVEATLSATGLAAECWLVAREGPEVRARIGPLAIPADGARDVSFVLPPVTPGAHGVTLAVEPSDRLDFDQRRFVVFEAAERPIVWLVTARDADPDQDVTSLILRNLLAPESLAPRRQTVTLRSVRAERVAAPRPADAQNARPSGEPVLIAIRSGTPLSESGAGALLKRLRRGATVLLVPGGAGDEVDWPGLRPLLAASRPRREKLETVTNIRWERDAPYSAAEEGLAELPRCAVRRRVVLGQLLDGVSVHARYADGVPAIVTKSVGRGRLLALTTSPDPSWSDLGIRAAGLLTWLHRLIAEATGPPARVARFRVNERTRHRFAGLPTRGLVRVSVDTDPESKPAWMRIADGLPQQDWPTDRPGLYTLRAGGKTRPPGLYAVNWPKEEADLSPVSLVGLKRRLGLERVTLEPTDGWPGEKGAGILARLMAGRDPWLAVPLVLVLLFVVEVLLSGRPGQPAESVGVVGSDASH